MTVIFCDLNTGLIWVRDTFLGPEYQTCGLFRFHFCAIYKTDYISFKRKGPKSCFGQIFVKLEGCIFEGFGDFWRVLGPLGLKTICLRSSKIVLEFLSLFVEKSYSVLKLGCMSMKLLIKRQVSKAQKRGKLLHI